MILLNIYQQSMAQVPVNTVLISTKICLRNVESSYRKIIQNSHNGLSKFIAGLSWAPFTAILGYRQPVVDHAYNHTKRNSSLGYTRSPDPPASGLQRN